MTAAIIPFPAHLARRAMTTAQRRVHLSNVATNPAAAAQARADAVIELINTAVCPAQADPWRDYGELLLADMKGAQA